MNLSDFLFFMKGKVIATKQINKKIEELLQLYYNNSFVLSSLILFQGEGTGLVSFYTKRDLDLSLKEQVQQQGTSPTIFLFI